VKKEHFFSNSRQFFRSNV